MDKILDTSVIIDGRIVSVCESGFLEGPLVVPQFVLHELQQIADSSDALRRNRAKRGFDVLQRLQRSAKVEVRIESRDFPGSARGGPEAARAGEGDGRQARDQRLRAQSSSPT